jgi:putative ABC transport system substrate-binding protein
MMRRREFITLLGGAAAAWPDVARAHQLPVKRIGALVIGNADEPSFRKRASRGFARTRLRCEHALHSTMAW